MIDFEPRGGIFDVDDTLLDNRPGVPGSGLHERSRLAAVHEAGVRHGIPGLAQLSVEDNLRGFLDAPVHTLEGAVWNIMMMTGLADSEVLNPDDPLLREIVDRKNELHEAILLEHGREVPGSTDFVRDFGALPSVGGRLAVASTAVRRDVGLYFGMVGLDSYFSAERIITKESITHPKPHSEAFDMAFNSLGLPESDRRLVCAFEDDPRGIMAAKAAGLYVCAITTRYTRHELMRLGIAPDMASDSYGEFREYFDLAE